VKRPDEIWLDEEGEEIFELSIAELARSLPQMLTWDTEPESRSGDIFVFRWGKIHGRYDAPDLEDGDPMKGRPYQATFPDVFVRLTANPIRHKKGHWQAPFVRVGFDQTHFMKRGGGSVPTALSPVVIDREVPLENSETDPRQEESNEVRRTMKRRVEQVTAKKRELKGVGPGTEARLRNEIRRLKDAA
jgi:hypothetical protein